MVLPWVINKLAQRRQPTSVADVPVDLARLRQKRLFIGLGAMKAGTTWVADYLMHYPSVFHSPVKEMNFFNRLHDNPMVDVGDAFRQEQIRDAVLHRNYRYPPVQYSYRLLTALVELDILASGEDYLSYFARRVQRESTFGEICPQYLTLPAETYRTIAGLGIDTVLLLFWRDPTERTASNIQHNLRRETFDVDACIEDLGPGARIWARNQYLAPFRALDAAGVDLPLEIFIYEDLFQAKAIERLCDVLGIPRRPADFGRQRNVSRGVKLTEAQKLRIREKLQPVYDELAAHFGDARPQSWRWTS